MKNYEEIKNFLMEKSVNANIEPVFVDFNQSIKREKFFIPISVTFATVSKPI